MVVWRQGEFGNVLRKGEEFVEGYIAGGGSRLGSRRNGKQFFTYLGEVGDGGFDLVVERLGGLAEFEDSRVVGLMF